MADTFTTITTFINSPPGQVVAGGVLGGVVWKFFERVESLLTENSKVEVALWLLDLKMAPRWQSVINTYVSALCGTSGLSWRSAVNSIITGTIAFLIVASPLENFFSMIRGGKAVSIWLPGVLSSELFVLFTCCSLTLTVIVLIDQEVRRVRQGRREILQILLMSTLFMFSMAFLVVFISVNGEQFGKGAPADDLRLLKQTANYYPTANMFIAMSVSSAWIWLYVVAGGILRIMHRLDIGFRWFNSTFDIEKKPFQSIGLVASALVALLFWTAALIRHFVG
jgi:hypothetical protein